MNSFARFFRLSSLQQLLRITGFAFVFAPRKAKNLGQNNFTANHQRLLKFISLILIFLSFKAALLAQNPIHFNENQYQKILMERAQATMSEAQVDHEFWRWLYERPLLFEGLLSASPKTDPKWVEWLSQLRNEFPPEQFDRYQGLMLVSVLGSQNPFEAPVYDEIKPSDEMIELAAQLREREVSLLTFSQKKEELMAEFDINPSLLRSDNDMIRLGTALGTYPKWEHLSIVEMLKLRIALQEQKMPSYESGPQWPLFPLEMKEWPLLAPLRQTEDKRVIEAVWNRFMNPEEEKRLPTYAQYSFAYTKPEIMFREDSFDPRSSVRIFQDGGVCGRLAMMCSIHFNSLGRPATNMREPGHNAVFSLFLDKEGKIQYKRMQSITSRFNAQVPDFLPPENSPRGKQTKNSLARPNLGDSYYGLETILARIATLRGGVDRWVRVRVWNQEAKRKIAQEDEQGARKILYGSLAYEPTSLEAWQLLFDLEASNPNKWHQLIDLVVNQDFNWGKDLPSTDSPQNFDMLKGESLSKAELMQQAFEMSAPLWFNQCLNSSLKSKQMRKSERKEMLLSSLRKMQEWDEQFGGSQFFLDQELVKTIEESLGEEMVKEIIDHEIHKMNQGKQENHLTLIHCFRVLVRPSFNDQEKTLSMVQDLLNRIDSNSFVRMKDGKNIPNQVGKKILKSLRLSVRGQAQEKVVEMFDSWMN